MNCEILRTLYVKANGEIPCNDDQGEQVSLGRLHSAAEGTGIVALLEGATFEHLRACFSSGRIPWPDLCESCALLRPNEPFGPDLLARKVLQKIQIETSLACALKCPSCSNLSQLRIRRGPVHLPIPLISRMLTELAEAGYRIETLELCGQGEPLNHPQFPELLACLRRNAPQSRLRLVTNANHDYTAKIGAVPIEETIVAIDGARQESYAQYRVNGRLERALSFLRDCVSAQHRLGGKVIWKYILFTSNDSAEELVEAQRLAHEIGVDHLWFVHGHGEMRSQKFTFENAAQFPVAYPRVKLESHPSYNRSARVWNNLGPGKRLSGPGGALWLDSFALHGNGVASLAGWVNLAHTGFDRARVSLDDGPWQELPCDISRPDVLAATPLFTQAQCGFDAQIATPPGLAAPRRLLVSLSSGTTELTRIELAFAP